MKVVFFAVGLKIMAALWFSFANLSLCNILSVVHMFDGYSGDCSGRKAM